MGKSKLPIELKPGSRIGVGLGRLILAHKTVAEDGLERWAVNYHLTADGPIRDTVFLSAQVLRYIAKVETLERDLKSSKEHSRRLKIRKEELENQLAKSENLRDVAQKTNKQRIDELELTNVELDLKIRSQYNTLVKSIDSQKNDYDLLNNHSKHLHSIINSEKEITASLGKSLDYQRSWSFGLFATTLLFFALWIAAMYF